MMTVTEQDRALADAMLARAFDEANAIVLDDLEMQDEWERGGRHHLDYTPDGEAVLVRLLAEQIAARREAEERAARGACSICAGSGLVRDGGTACVCRDGTAAGEAIALRERVRELEALLPGECCRGSNPACAAGCAVEQAGLAVVRERDALREHVRVLRHAGTAFVAQCAGPMRDGGDVGEWLRRLVAFQATLAPLLAEQEPKKKS